MELKNGLAHSLMWSLSASGLPKLVARRHAGQGAILSFHRIHRPDDDELLPKTLSISPENFRSILQALLRQGYRFLSMSALVDRLREGDHRTDRFVSVTFDDGFVDNYTAAFPICRELGVPMTIYLVSSFVRREFPMWGFGLEAAVRANDVLEFAWEGVEVRLETSTRRQKRDAYDAIAARFVGAQPEKIRQACDQLGSRCGIDFMASGAPYMLSLPMIAEMQASGLVEFGAHGVHHANLGRLDDGAAFQEIEQSKRDCEALLHAEVQHFAFPYGDRIAAGRRESEFCRKLGFRSAVTTESNTIFAADRDRLFSLPRLTFNGLYQDAPLLDLLLSGTLPLLRRAFNVRAGSTRVTASRPTAYSSAARR